jgi:hypothetical protein
MRLLFGVVCKCFTLYHKCSMLYYKNLITKISLPKSHENLTKISLCGGALARYLSMVIFGTLYVPDVNRMYQIPAYSHFTSTPGLFTRC